MRFLYLPWALVLAFASPLFAGRCEMPTMPTGLSERDGYIDFLNPTHLAQWKARLPEVEEVEVASALRSSDTMWYDDESIIFSYQDSIETVVGGRANCVARVIGESSSIPGIAKLKNFFGPDYKFLFPFRTVAGTDNVTNIKSLNFWVPPRRTGKVMPVKWWKQSSRGRWSWVFPVGTLFGEVLFQKAPNQQWYVFEIRTRKRYSDGWEPNVYRPFHSAQALATAIMFERPGWKQNANLKNFVEYLRNNNTLTPHRLESVAYGKVFQPVEGALDVLPDSGDSDLIATLLTSTAFTSAEGKIWKENGRLETYAPSSASDFNIVPKNYEMGMIAVNEVSCGRCHSETGRRLADFEFDVQLYGEIWGEDRIFTWHLFKPQPEIFGPFDDQDGSRVVNPRLVKAGLLSQGKPSAGDPDYRPLPSAFVPEKRSPKPWGAQYEYR